MPNFCMLAQNSFENDYVKQAYLCAMSIRATTPNSKICLITNDTVSENYRAMFDDIEEIPWGDAALESLWKVENRWKIYHTCPYDKVFVLDTDMLVLEDITRWWDYLVENTNLLFTTNVTTYRGEVVTSNYYRKSFVNHNLPNIYSGLFFYQKTDETKYFFQWLELVMKNWELFQGEFAGGKYFQKHPSLDVAAAIVAKVLGLGNKVINDRLSYPSFVHMKTFCQNWEKPLSDSWQKIVGTYLTSDLKLKIGNYQQSGVFHYTENNFVTSDVIKKYEKYLGII